MRPLTYILLFVFVTCVLTMCGDPANAVSFKPPNMIEMNETEMKLCEEQGGRVLITQDAIDEAVAKIELLERQLKAEKSKRCV